MQPASGHGEWKLDLWSKGTKPDSKCCFFTLLAMSVPDRFQPWMYYRIWIQWLLRASDRSYESCSVAKKQKWLGFLGSNLAALLCFPNVIRPNGSNPDDETSYFTEVWTVKISMELQMSLSPCKWILFKMLGLNGFGSTFITMDLVVV